MGCEIMNWSDVIVLAIIGIFGLIGLSNGFIFSLFKLASFFIAVIFSVKFYPILSNLLASTPIFTKIKSSIYDNLIIQQQAQSQGVNEGAKASAGTVIEGLKLPGFLKDAVNKYVVENMPEVSSLVDVASIVERISDVLAHLVINIISLVLLYIIVRVGLIFVKGILRSIAKLPVFKQMDKLGGIAFGALEGLLTVYIVFAVLMLFHTWPVLEGFFEMVETSVAAKFFYENNFIVNWMFTKGIVS
ncbi:UNVERIFIED_CONTAM: putative membrane protein, required for colicin V production [Acetivibrio alkalicellulosi]